MIWGYAEELWFNPEFHWQKNSLRHEASIMSHLHSFKHISGQNFPPDSFFVVHVVSLKL